MTKRTDLFYSTYGKFTEDVLTAIRKETFGEDIGQNSWLTSEEFDTFLSWLDVSQEKKILEVSSGSGGPALYLAKKTGCQVTGIDINEKGIAAALKIANDSEYSHLLNFIRADANDRLPFGDEEFDYIICIDSMNHYPDRLNVFREWHRVLRKGGRALFTDPVVITGPITNDELALRSSIGLFLFVPPLVNEKLISEAGFNLLMQKDVSDNAALTSGRWFNARLKYKSSLLKSESKEQFDNLQKFFDTVKRLTSEKRCSRIVYLAEK